MYNGAQHAEVGRIVRAALGTGWPRVVSEAHGWNDWGYFGVMVIEDPRPPLPGGNRTHRRRYI